MWSRKKQWLLLSAGEMARGVKEGKWTSRELLEVHIERIHEVNPVINAVAVPLFEEALLAAGEADQAIARGEQVGPLHGVPVTIKEAIDIAGTPSTWGLPSRRTIKILQDDPSVAALRRAGAIVLGKTNVMQLLMGCESNNPVYGRSRNPWNPKERSSGGSSGGEAAIIAAGGSPLGLGTDVGGSIRTPAHFCGIHGLKPTPGRVPSSKPEGLKHVAPEAAIMASTGPMARRVEDLVLAMELISSPESLERAPIRGKSSLSVNGLRVGFYTSDGILAPSASLQRAVREAALALERCGAVVEEFTLPNPEKALHGFYGLITAAGLGGLTKTVGTDELTAQIANIQRSLRLSGWKKWTGAAVLRLLGQKIAGTHVLPFLGEKTDVELQVLVQERENYQQRFLKEMERRSIDVLITPPFLVPSVQHDQSLRMTFEGTYALLYNYLGMPAGVVSTTRVRLNEEATRSADRDQSVQAARNVEGGSSGLPIGVQVAARPWGEDLVLAVMGCLEREFAGTDEYPVGRMAGL